MVELLVVSRPPRPSAEQLLRRAARPADTFGPFVSRVSQLRPICNGPTEAAHRATSAHIEPELRALGCAFSDKRRATTAALSPLSRPPLSLRISRPLDNHLLGRTRGARGASASCRRKHRSIFRSPNAGNATRQFAGHGDSTSLLFGIGSWAFLCNLLRFPPSLLGFDMAGFDDLLNPT
jgi:hypothetical protein